jgi:hypothetical protein
LQIDLVKELRELYTEKVTLERAITALQELQQPGATVVTPAWRAFVERAGAPNPGSSDEVLRGESPDGALTNSHVLDGKIAASPRP